MAENPFHNLRIYYSSLSAPHFIDCPCNRWDTQDYSITIGTTLNKTQRDTLYNHITPGAVGTLYVALGRPHFYDKTWRGKNTLRIVPNPITPLAEMRSEKIIYVKNYSEHPINPEKIKVKIEGYVSGSQEL